MIANGLPKLRIHTFQWIIGVFCAIRGAMILIVPHQFGAFQISPLDVHLSIQGGLLLLGGFGLIASVAIAPRRPAVVVAHIIAAVALFILTVGQVMIGSWNAIFFFGVLSLAVLIALVVPPPPDAAADPPGRSRDYFALVMGVSTLLIGLSYIFSLQQYIPPPFDQIAPFLFAYGVALSLGGAALVAVTLAPAPPRLLFYAAHVFVGLLLLVWLIVLRLTSWNAWVAFGGLGVTLMVLPWLGPYLARVDPASLRTRLAVALAAVAAVPLILAVALSAEQQERAVAEQALARQQNQAFTLSRYVYEYLDLHRSAVLALSFTPGLIEAAPDAQITVLRTFDQAYDDVIVFATFDVDGNPIARSDTNGGLPMSTVFEAARESGEPVLQVRVGQAVARPVFTFGAPVLDANGQFTGLIAGSVDSERVADVLRADRDLGDLVYLLDENNQVIARSSELIPDLFTNLSTVEPVVSLRSNPSPTGGLTYMSTSGERLVGYAAVPELGWEVVVERPASQVLVGVRQGREVAFFILLAVTVLAVIVGIALANWMSRSLVTLAHASGRLAAGYAEAPLPNSRVREVAFLSNAFATMRDRLTARTRERDEAEARLRLLADASSALSASLEYRQTLTDVSQVAVPLVADYCIVDMVLTDGTLQRVAVASADPAQAELAQRLQRNARDSSQLSHTRQVLEQGELLVQNDISAEAHPTGEPESDHQQLLRALGLTATLAVLITARGRALGVLTFVMGPSGRRFSEEDVALAQELATRAGQAVDNARLYHEAQAQRRWFAGTLASIGDAVIATDAQGCVTFINPVAQTLTGWPEQDALGVPLEQVFAIINEHTLEPVESPVAKVLREGAIVGLANHTLLVARDGSTVPIDDSGAPIRNDNGEIIGVVLVFRDITERQQSEAALRESEARFRTMADSAPVLIWVSRTDGLCTFFNKPWLDFTGRTFEQEWGDGWTEGVHPDDREFCLTTYDSHFTLRVPFEMEYRLRRADGVYRWLLDRGTPRYHADGSFAGYIGSCIDISERRQTEETLRVFARISAVLTASLDEETILADLAHMLTPNLADVCATYLEENGALRLIEIAYTDPEETADARMVLEAALADPESVLNPARVLQSGKSEFMAEFSSVLTRDTPLDSAPSTAAFAPISSITVPLLNDGSVMGVIQLLAISSVRRHTAADFAMAEELARRSALAVANARLHTSEQQARTRAEAAIHVRDQFLSIAAHELKTPLTSLLGNAQLMERRAVREGSLTERYQRNLRVIVDQANRLNRMIAALLDISRLETGQFSIAREMMDLDALLRQVIEEVQPMLESHTLEYQAPAGPLMIAGDVLRLEQVFQNLVQNAIKYSPAGGPVTLRLERRDQLVCVDVTDRGIGIADEALPFLFNRFYRVETAETEHISGTGIGLYVVREIVTMHGGTVTVQSTKGAGSTFTVCLPLDQHSTADMLPATTERDISEEQRNGNKRPLVQERDYLQP